MSILSTTTTTMNMVKETFIQLMSNEQIKKELHGLIKPIGQLIYNEIYLYVWFLCMYHVLLLFIIVAVFCLLLRSRETISTTLKYNVN
jgi:hypothetical protein